MTLLLFAHYPYRKKIRRQELANETSKMILVKSTVAFGYVDQKRPDTCTHFFFAILLVHPVQNFSKDISRICQIKVAFVEYFFFPEKSKTTFVIFCYIETIQIWSFLIPRNGSDRYFVISISFLTGFCTNYLNRCNVIHLAT